MSDKQKTPRNQNRGEIIEKIRFIEIPGAAELSKAVVPDTGKAPIWFEDHDGSKLYGYVYPDGTIRDAQGAYLKAPPWVHRPFDQAIAKVLSDRRWEAYRIHATNGLVKAAEDGQHIPIGFGPGDAYAAVVGHQAKLALTADDKVSVMAAQFVQKAIGALPSVTERRQQAEGGTTNNIAFVFQGAAADKVLPMIDKLQEVLDVE